MPDRACVMSRRAGSPARAQLSVVGIARGYPASISWCRKRPETASGSRCRSLGQAPVPSRSRSVPSMKPTFRPRRVAIPFPMTAPARTGRTKLTLISASGIARTPPERAAPAMPMQPSSIAATTPPCTAPNWLVIVPDTSNRSVVAPVSKSTSMISRATPGRFVSGGNSSRILRSRRVGSVIGFTRRPYDAIGSADAGVRVAWQRRPGERSVVVVR